MKSCHTAALLAALTTASFASAVHAKPNSNTKPYPYGNPVIKHMYTADAAPHVMPDGRVWMVTSVDHEKGGGYSTMHQYHNFSSSDLLNWHDHGTTFTIDDVHPNEDPKVDDWALWAPDMIYRDGKYYMYYPLFIRHRQDLRPNGMPKVTAYTGVAVTDSLDKPWKVLTERLEGTQGIDPAIFIDDDDQVYLYYGHAWAAKLKDNMYEIDGKPWKLEIGDTKGTNTELMEAVWMHKRQGKYYFNYHTKYDKPIAPENPDDPKRKKSRLDYSWGDTPIGPLNYGGILNYELGSKMKEGPKLPGRDFVPWRLYQSNHGGVVEYHGKDYLFYHTSALSSWRQDEFKGPGTWTQRSVCVDEIQYNDDGTVKPVVQTLSGPTPVKVNQPFAIPLGDASIKVAHKFSNVPLGTGYYYLSAVIQDANVDGKLEVRLGSPNGQLAGTITLTQKRMADRQGYVDTFLREARGTQDVYLVHKKGAKTGNLKLKNIQFFAGSPKPLS